MAEESIDTRFLTGNYPFKWGSSHLTFTLLDTGPFYFYTLNPATIFAYNNTGPWFVGADETDGSWDSEQGIFSLLGNANQSVIDQMDTVRYLLADVSYLENYNDGEIYNEVDQISTQLLNGASYRVSFPDVVNLSFSEKPSIEGKGDVLLFNGWSSNAAQSGIRETCAKCGRFRTGSLT